MVKDIHNSLMELTAFAIAIKPFEESFKKLTSGFQSLRKSMKSAAPPDMGGITETVKQFMDRMGIAARARPGVALEKFGIPKTAYRGMSGTMIGGPAALSTPGFGAGGNILGGETGGVMGGMLGSSRLGAGQALQGVMGGATKGLMGFVGLMGKVVKFPLEKFGGFAKGMGNFVGKAMGLKPAQMNAIGGMLGGLGGAIGSMGIGMLVQVAMQLLDALNPFKPLMEALSEIFGVYGEILSTAFMPLIEKLFEVMMSEPVLMAITSLAGAIGNIVVAFLPLIDIIAPFAAILLTGLVVVLNLAATAVSWLSIPLQFLGGVFGMVGGWILQAVGPITWFFGVLSGGFRDAFNFIIGIFNGLTAKINSWDVLNWFPDLPMIPTLDTGGIVTGPTLANLSMNNVPEAVIPLPELQNGGFGGKTFNITIGKLDQNTLRDLKREMWIAQQT